MAVRGGAPCEVLDQQPWLPLVDLEHLERWRRVAGHHRPSLQHDDLARSPLGEVEVLELHQLGVHRLDGAADGGRGERGHERRRAVCRLALHGLEHAGADPAGAGLVDDGCDVARWDVELDVTVPVQAAGLIGLDFARRPVLTVPGLPGERRVVGVHADALDVAGEFEPQNARGHRIAETDHERVVGLGHRREAGRARAAVESLGAVGERLAVGHGPDPGHRARHDVKVGRCREDDGLLRLGPDRGNLGTGGDPHGLRKRRRQPERLVGPRRRGWKEADADQLEEFHVQPVRNAVQAVEQLVGHPCERFDERDARVGHVVVGPLGALLRDQPLRVVDEVLEPAIVEVRGRQDHVRQLLILLSQRPVPRPGSRRTGRRGCGDRSRSRWSSARRCRAGSDRPGRGRQ